MGALEEKSGDQRSQGSSTWKDESCDKKSQQCPYSGIYSAVFLLISQNTCASCIHFSIGQRGTIVLIGFKSLKAAGQSFSGSL